ANPDMVGHTGVFQAAVQAVQATDVALGVVLEAVEEVGGEALVLADHGNAECMLQPDGSAHTAHTTNPVPCIYVGRQSVTLRSGGALCDVAPTLLRLLEIPQPREMSGRCLIQP
ncbi:MAG TPA: 2,3-bisphosphoglycerate-independent phosphoglycerate mutase, partial [Candidatus Bipolaricaulota bacterium]